MPSVFIPIRTPRRRIPKLCRRPDGLAYVTLDGRRRYLGRHDAPDVEAKYEAALAEWLAGGAPGRSEAGIMIVELIERFHAHCLEYYGPDASHIDRIKAPLRDLRRLYGDMPARDFGPLKLRALREIWIDRNRARATINDWTACIKSMFSWGVSMELVPAELHTALSTVAPLKRGRSRARETKPVQPVSDEHVEAALAHLPAPVAAMVRLQALTGARVGEIVGLRPMDIDRRDPAVWTATLEKHKMAYRGRERVLYFGPQAQEILRPFLLRDADRPLFSPKEAERERHVASRTGKGRRPDQVPNPKKTDRVVRDSYDRRTYNRAIERACRKAGIPVFSSHQLRHACATKLRHAMGLEAAQVVLGHAHADVTQIYAEANHARARDIAITHG